MRSNPEVINVLRGNRQPVISDGMPNGIAIKNIMAEDAEEISVISQKGYVLLGITPIISQQVSVTITECDHSHDIMFPDFSKAL